MKFAAALALFLAVPAYGLVGSVFEDDLLKDHAWCCTDAACPESCAEYNSLKPGDLPPIDVLTPPFVDPECVTTGPTVLDGAIVTLVAGEDCNYPGGPACCNEGDFFKGFTYNTVFNQEASAAMYCDHKFGPTSGGGDGTYSALCRPTVVGEGDPHFKRWNGEWYDFHGECDLTFINAPNFGLGVGMDITIRTTQRHGYSYIESAAMRIGEDILEVSSWADHKLNGVVSANMEGAHLGPFEIEYTYVNSKTQIFSINAGNGQVIQMKTFKDLVDVKLETVTHADFEGATGMMGAFPSGSMVARDGKTVIEDPNEYAAEWQVRAEDPQLFSTLRAPQYPAKCIMPSTTEVASRRLGESGVSTEAAEMACAHHADAERRENCIYDVKASGDLELATAGAY